MKLRLVGQDPSLRNWGLSTGTYDTTTRLLTIDHVDVVRPVLSTNKRVRQNSLDLESAKQLCQGALEAVKGAHAVFVEVPVGSQSARAMASYGICVGIMGALRAQGTPFFEVSPAEVKMASVGYKTATKQEMIDWAVGKHPEANWPKVKKNGALCVSASQAEHAADATAAIYAGLSCDSFQQMLPFFKAAKNQ